MGLLGNCFLTWRRWLSREYSPYGVTLKQLYILRRLKSVQFLYPSDIADMLFADRPTVTVIIRNLARDGLVRKVRDSDDGKRTRVILTDKGRDKAAVLTKESDRIGEHIDPFSCFTEAQRKQFVKLLKTLTDHLGKLPDN